MMSLSRSVNLMTGAKMPSFGLLMTNGLFKAVKKNEETAIANHTRNALNAGFRHFSIPLNAMITGGYRGFGSAVEEARVVDNDLFVCGDIGLWETGAELERNLVYVLESTRLSQFDLLKLRYNRRLNMDDLLQLWQKCETLHDQGLVKAIGITNIHDLSILDEIYEKSVVKPAVVEDECHCYLPQNRLRELCKQRDIAFTAWLPYHFRRYSPDAILSSVKADIEPMVEKHQMTEYQIMVRYNMELSDSILIEYATHTSLADLTKICDFKLDEEDLFKLRGLLEHQYRFLQRKNTALQL